MEALMQKKLLSNYGKDQKIAEIMAPALLGESALKTRERRNADVIASKRCRCLILNKKDYESSILAFAQIKKNENNQLIKQMDVIKNWNLGNINTYAD